MKTNYIYIGMGGWILLLIFIIYHRIKPTYKESIRNPFRKVGGAFRQTLNTVSDTATSTVNVVDNTATSAINVVDNTATSAINVVDTKLEEAQRFAEQQVEALRQQTLILDFFKKISGSVHQLMESVSSMDRQLNAV